MIELPLSWRTLFVEALDQYCDSIDETTTQDDIAEALIEQAEAIAEQVHGVESETLLAQPRTASKTAAGSSGRRGRPRPRPRGNTGRRWWSCSASADRLPRDH